MSRIRRFYSMGVAVGKFLQTHIYVPKGNAMYLPDFHVNITTTCTGGFEIFYLIDVQKG